MDLPSTFLLIIISILSIILIIVGIQLIGLIRDAKETLEKLDNILEDVGFLSRSLTQSSSTLTHLSEGLKSGMQLVGTITQLFNKEKK